MNVFNNHFNVLYEFNNKIYDISGTEEFHNNMKQDEKFAMSYLQEIESQSDDNNNEAISENEDENFHEREYNVDNENDYLNPQDDSVKDKEQDKEDESVWDNAAIKLLLHEYLIRNTKFRNPKIKKVVLWREIASKFTKENLNFSWQALAKKFGNMKTTYSKIKRNNSKKTTGTGRKPWIWLKSMDEIFHNDKSINFVSNIIKSLSAEANEEILNLSSTSSSGSNNDSGSVNNGSTRSVGSKAKLSNADIHSGEDIGSASSKYYKSARGKITYYHRQKQLSLDSDKLEMMRDLKDTLEKCNNVQKENILVWTQKMDELTEIYKQRNELLKQIIESTK